MKTPLIVLVSLAALLSTRGFASIVELNEVKKFDRQAYIGSNVELECDLKNFYDSPVLWRKLVGVSFVGVLYYMSISVLLLLCFFYYKSE